MERDFQKQLEATIKDLEISARKEYEAMGLESASDKKLETKLEVDENQDKENLEANNEQPENIKATEVERDITELKSEDVDKSDEQDKIEQTEFKILDGEVESAEEPEDFLKDRYLEDEAEALRKIEADQDISVPEPSDDVIEQLESHDLSELMAELGEPEIEVDKTEPVIEPFEILAEPETDALEKQEEEGLP